MAAIEPWEKAADCERSAQTTIDPHSKVILHRLRLRCENDPAMRCARIGSICMGVDDFSTNHCPAPPAAP